MVQTQIGLGIVVNQDQKSEIEDTQLEILNQYLNIIFEGYTPVEVYNFESTIAMTTFDLSEKIQAVCGVSFSEVNINNAMIQAGFVLKP